MITSREELKSFLDADKKALGRNRNRPVFYDYIWRYEVLLRKCEYYSNIKATPIRKITLILLKMKKIKLGALCGFDIPINTTGKGLCLAHIGPVIISKYAIIGENCKIHAGVNIGADARKFDAAPIIGDNVYIGPGAKLYGKIVVANNIAIGANAVVNQSFVTPSVTIGGIPGKVISSKGVDGILHNIDD